MNENRIPQAGTEQKLDVRVKVYPVKEENSKLLAFASVTLNGCFAVNGIRLMDSEKSAFVAMPSRKDKDGSYHDICCPTTKEMRQALNAAILGEYEKAVERPSVRGALQSAAKESAARPAPDVLKSAGRDAR